MSLEGGDAEVGPAIQRHCSNYGKTGYNIRTCQVVEEMLDEGSYIESD